MVFITITSSEKGVMTFSFSKPLICNERSRVGLSEVLLPNCLPQIRASETPYIQIHKYTRESRRERDFHFRETYNVISKKDLYFKDIEDLLTYLNAQIAFSGIRLTYLKQIDRINIQFILLQNKQYRLSLGSRVNEILGLPSESPEDVFYTSRIGAIEPDLYSGKRKLFIYTPFIKPILVGNLTSPLLRLININNKKSYTHHIFQNPFYLPLLAGVLYEIKLHIIDQNGRYMSFPKNKWIRVTLHFIDVN